VRFFVPMFFLFTCLQVFSADYMPMETNSEDTVPQLEDCSTSYAQCSINYLKNMPDANWFWPKVTAAATFLSLPLGIIPGSVVCTMVDGFTPCFQVTVTTVLLSASGLGAGIIGTCHLLNFQSKKAAIKENYLNIAKLIENAYAFDSQSENVIASYLENYQLHCPTNEHTPKDLAEKIRLANEAGLFVPIDAYSANLINKDFESLKTCEDAPKIHNIFGNSFLGTYFGYEPQGIVNSLIPMTKEQLELRKSKFLADIEKWKTEVEEYLQSVKIVQEKRSAAQLAREQG
jgi:hypothetical protein